ncbi:MAG: hydrogenase 3 maturation endopeptidase HyCI [Gemmatimonadetes bacterium]|nr:hydrogenase 3 maturation endopeptidase HyCI [Gemmatimonadota bacterium]
MRLADRLRGRVAVVGVGNPLRADDGVGCRIAGALADACRRGPLARRGGLTVVDAEDVPENFLGVVTAARPDVVLFVDSANLGASPGSSALLDAATLDDAGACTHRTPLRLTASLIERLTGAAVLLLAVQPASLEWGEPMSEPVAASADHLTALLQEALAC